MAEAISWSGEFRVSSCGVASIRNSKSVIRY